MYKQNLEKSASMTVVKYFFPVLVLDIAKYAAVSAQSTEGNLCNLKSGQGTCRVVDRCKSVYDQLLAGNQPELVCGYDRGSLPIVCCPNSEGNGNSHQPMSSTAKSKPGSTTTKKPPIATTQRTTATKIRPACKRPAERMCTRYACEVYGLQEQPAFTAGDRQLVNVSLCAIKSKTLIVGGTRAAPKEFPHMAALGYVTRGHIFWQCGGSLISEKFVLTAAHCLTSKNHGPPKWVRVGDLNIKVSSDDARPQDRRIAEMIKHPNYRQMTSYNDIALLKLDRPVTFDAYVRPACLSLVPRFPDNEKAVAVGWGLFEIFDEEGSDDLLKVTLPIIPHAKCNTAYKSYKDKLSNGIDDDCQLCAGGQRGKDTCQGDSGGPLAVYNTNEECMYDIIGVTSFGRTCGSDYPAVYARVYNYVSWIENIVWPNLN